MSTWQTPFCPPAEMAVIGVAVSSAVTDLWKGKIYNAITYPATAAGVLIALGSRGLSGMCDSVVGWASGLLPAGLLFAAGAIGGGDVKLLGAIGALTGAWPVAETFGLALIIGGVMAVGQLAWKGELLSTLVRTGRRWIAPIVPARAEPSAAGRVRAQVRFGVAIGIALLLTLWDLHRLGDPHAW